MYTSTGTCQQVAHSSHILCIKVSARTCLSFRQNTKTCDNITYTSRPHLMRANRSVFTLCLGIYWNQTEWVDCATNSRFDAPGGFNRIAARAVRSRCRLCRGRPLILGGERVSSRNTSRQVILTSLCACTAYSQSCAMNSPLIFGLLRRCQFNRRVPRNSKGIISVKN